MQLKKTNQLAIPDLSSKVTIRTLLDAFSRYENKVVSIKLNKQRRGKDEDLQVGYIEFDDVDVTETAYGDGNIKVEGESKALHYAKKKDQRIKEKVTISNKKLFVSGIPSDAEKDEICSLLGDCKISGADKGRSYIFAEYENSEKQEEALNRLNNSQIRSSRLFATPAYEKADLNGGRFVKRRND
uniref:PolyA-binding protein n=1 Tax=Sporanauta perivermis TaxID=1261140 RepID=A0A4D6DKW4_9MICR|nr:polyA-binding protein [Sporanauta perivermis]